MVTTEVTIGVVVGVGVPLLLLIIALMYWFFCYRTSKRYREQQLSPTYVNNSNNNAIVVKTGNSNARLPPPPTATLPHDHNVPLHITTSPQEGTYAAPQIVHLHTLQPNLDILVRIVAVKEGQEEYTLSSPHPSSTMLNVSGGAGNKDTVGLLLYRDPLEFREPGVYYVLAHTLSFDKQSSEVQQFIFRITDSAAVLPPVISPGSGDVLAGTCVALHYPVTAGSSSVHRRVDEAMAELSSDITMWYSLDGSFPSIRYVAPFALSLPSHVTKVTIRAVATSTSLHIASEVADAKLNIVSAVYSFFDPEIASPSLHVQATSSVLYFENIATSSRLPQQHPYATNNNAAAGVSAPVSAAGAEAGMSFGGVYQLPPLGSTSLGGGGGGGGNMFSRYDLVGADWKILYCLDYNKHSPQGSRSGEGVLPHESLTWALYEHPVALRRDVSRIAAYTLCTLVAQKTSLRSKVVVYDMSLGVLLQGDSAPGSVVSGSDTMLPRKKSKKSSSRKNRNKSDGEDVDEAQDAPRAPTHADMLSVNSGYPLFPPLPLSNAREDKDIPTPGMCVGCSDLEAYFDDPLRGGRILYTLNGDDPDCVIDAAVDSHCQTFEYTCGKPLKIKQCTSEDRVIVTARMFYPLYDRDHNNGAAQPRGYRYGHIFSREFRLQ